MLRQRASHRRPSTWWSIATYAAHTQHESAFERARAIGTTTTTTIGKVICSSYIESQREREIRWVGRSRLPPLIVTSYVYASMRAWRDAAADVCSSLSHASACCVYLLVAHEPIGIHASMFAPYISSSSYWSFCSCQMVFSLSTHLPSLRRSQIVLILFSSNTIFFDCICLCVCLFSFHQLTI